MHEWNIHHLALQINIWDWDCTGPAMDSKCDWGHLKWMILSERKKSRLGLVTMVKLVFKPWVFFDCSFLLVWNPGGAGWCLKVLDLYQPCGRLAQPQLLQILGEWIRRWKISFSLSLSLFLFPSNEEINKNFIIKEKKQIWEWYAFYLLKE